MGNPHTDTSIQWERPLRNLAHRWAVSARSSYYTGSLLPNGGAPVTATLVFTFIAADQPGLVEKLSQTVDGAGGNWMESHMSQLAGQFAGTVQVELPQDRVDDLTRDLLALRETGLTLVVQPAAAPAPSPEERLLSLSIIGPDRTGIVREVAAALAASRINVVEMTTAVVSAPMSAEALFEACATIAVPPELPLEQLGEQLDRIADQLAVDIALEEDPE